MAFTILDQGAGLSDIQSILFRQQLEWLVDGMNDNNCVVTGCAVTDGTTGTKVSIAKGAVLTNGVLRAVTAVADALTPADGHATLPRIDLIVIDSSGAKAVRQGTAAYVPKPPDRTANDVVLAMLYIPGGATNIAAANIMDMRVMRTTDVLLYKLTTPVKFTGTNAIQTYLSLTFPNGLLLAGKIARVNCGGFYMNNSGTSTYTWTLTISYGGTTLFADVTGSVTTDADNGAWNLIFDLAAQSNTIQRLNGMCNFQLPGARTVPYVGHAGQLEVTGHYQTPICGTTAASVDSDSANRDLLVRWTMSNAGAGLSTTINYGTVELL